MHRKITFFGNPEVIPINVDVFWEVRKLRADLAWSNNQGTSFLPVIDFQRSETNDAWLDFWKQSNRHSVRKQPSNLVRERECDRGVLVSRSFALNAAAEEAVRYQLPNNSRPSAVISKLQVEVQNEPVLRCSMEAIDYFFNKKVRSVQRGKSNFACLRLNAGLFSRCFFKDFTLPFSSPPQLFGRSPQGECENGYRNTRQRNPNIIRSTSTSYTDVDPAIEPRGIARTRMWAVLGAPLLFLYLALVNCVGRRKKKNSKEHYTGKIRD